MGEKRLFPTRMKSCGIFMTQLHVIHDALKLFTGAVIRSSIQGFLKGTLELFLGIAVTAITGILIASRRVVATASSASIASAIP